MKKIVLIEPKESGWNVFSLFKLPRLGLPILGTLLKKRGYEVTIFIEKISKIDWRVVYEADVVGVSLVSNTCYEGYEIAQKVRDKGIPVILGGPHATFESEEALQYGDYVVRGEGEESLLELMKVIETDGDLAEVRGLSYWDNGKPKHNPDQDFCQNIEITPDYSLVHGFKEFYRRRFHLGFAPLEVLTTRGCPYGCKFCSVIKMSGRKMRKRSVKNVIAEIEGLVREYKPRSIWFVDDNFTADKERAKEILREIIARKVPCKFSAQVRVETANDPELMQLLKDAGVHLVQVGLESINPETLKVLNKGQTLEDMEKSIKTFNSYKIKVFGMFMIGSDYDTPETAIATAKFAKDLKLMAIQILALGPIPGTDLTKELAEENRIISRDWRKYDGNHVMVFARKMPPTLAQESILAGYKEFYTLRQAWQYLWHGYGGYYTGINLFGYFTARYLRIKLKPYIRFLYWAEKGKYLQEGDKYELIEPVNHVTQEAPLDYPSPKAVERLFGPLAQTFSKMSWRRFFPSDRLVPVGLRLPEGLADFPNNLSRFLRKTKRPVVIDLSKWNIQDKIFWQKIYVSLRPFSKRVRLRVASGKSKLFTQLGLKGLQELAIDDK